MLSTSFTKLNDDIADAEIPDALARGYREAPTALKSTNRNLHDRILFYISNAKGREDYEREANGNYITLIGLIVAEDDDADAEIATWANSEKNKLSKQGLTANTSSTSCVTATTPPSSPHHRAARTRSRGTSPPTDLDKTADRRWCARASRY